MERDPIDGLVDEARDDLDAVIAAEEAAIRPDFAAILEEARRRGQAPLTSSIAGRDEALDDAFDGDDDLAGDAALTALCDEARAEIDADRAARRLLPIPPPPLPIAAPRLRPRRWLGAALAIAAAVALVWGVGPYLARPLDGDAQGGSQAQYRDRVVGESRGAAEVGPPEGESAPRGGGRRRASAGATDLVEASGPIDPVPPALSEGTDPVALDPGADPGAIDSSPAASDAIADPAPDADAIADAPRDPHAPKADGKLDARALEREAEARWRAGDLAGAERSLRAIIRGAEDRRQVDLAYGDLFTITRQLHGREREAAVWTEYLRRFPRGHYADDARAGLCRRAEGEAHATCWTRYLADFPGGSHRAEAERGQGEP